MRALLDINFLIAILDQAHPDYSAAIDWFHLNQQFGWASCCLTENGVVRIMSNPSYGGGTGFTIIEIRTLLSNFIASTDHEFWSADISINDDSIFRGDQFLGPKQVTDIYLLGLAVRNRGRLVTFDSRITTNSVVGAVSDNLVGL